MQHFGVIAQFAGRSRVADHAAFHDVGAGGQAKRHRRELLDQQHPDPGVRDGADDRDQPAHHHRGQAQGQLVDQDVLRLGDQRLGEHHHLLLAAGQGPGGDGQPFFQSREQLQGAGTAGRGRRPGQRVGGHPDVVVDCQVGQQSPPFRDDRDPGGADLLRPLAGQFGAVHEHRPRPRAQHAADSEDHGGLAGAVRAEDGGHLPGGDGDRHVLDNRPAAAFDGQAA